MSEPSDAPLVEFIRYNTWANLRLLEACETLSPEQLAASAPGTYGTIARTLEHLVDSEAFYYKLLTGQTLPPPFRWEDNPAVPAIRAYYDQVGQAFIEAAARANPAGVLHQKWQGGSAAYKALALLIPIVNHGVEHRTNVTTILTGLGATPPELDGWSYMWANRDRLGAE
jgi:uncharacterized damage-inducible protein DinB